MEKGMNIIKKSGLNIITVKDMDEGAKKIIDLIQ